ALIESDRPDSGSGIRPKTGQPQQFFFRYRKVPLIFIAYLPCASVQRTRPAVIAKAGPHPHYLFEFGFGQMLYGWPALDEFLEIRPNRRHRRLLQHDFGQPDAIGISLNPRQSPPW